MKRLYSLACAALFSTACVMAQNNTPQGLTDVNGVRDVTLDSLAKANQARPVSGSSRRNGHPVLFLVGNSTMRNGTLGNGNNGQWGWGYFAHEYFDENKITVENHALGGTSPRTFYRMLWPAVLQGVQKGDYVILELGHNDNGPLAEGRARASYQGADGHSPLSHDSIEVTIKETGKREMVYTFGGYIRRFVNEVRSKGATPILFTLTPRKAYESADTNRIDRKLTTFTPWIKALALELGTPCIDLNDISATKLERYGKWKASYHFFGDKIHSSAFGAKMNAASCAEGIEACTDPQIAGLRSCILTERIHPHSLKEGQPQKDKKGRKIPTVFITGDSTVKNEDNDKDGMWGWGALAESVFDTNKCNVINAAKAGRSTRTFLEEGRWDAVYNSVDPGDYVLIEFGHNDIGNATIAAGKQRGTIATADDTCHVYKLESNGQYEVIYSFGWYLKKFIQDVREKGGTPILVSLTPRNEWPGGKIERRNDSYGKWYRQVVDETHVDFIDLHNITADKLDRMGQEKARAMYNHDHTHTSFDGAMLNARNIGRGIKKLNNSKLKKLLKGNF